MADTTDLKGDHYDTQAAEIIEKCLVENGVVLRAHQFANLADAVAAALRASPWRYDMENAPRDGTVLLLYFPLEDLDDHWQRINLMYWPDGPNPRWTFAGRAAAGFSRDYQPSAWMIPLPPEGERR